MARVALLEKIGQTIEHGSQILGKLRLWGAHSFALRNRISEITLSPAWSLLPLVRLFLFHGNKCGFADLLVLLIVQSDQSAFIQIRRIVHDQCVPLAPV